MDDGVNAVDAIQDGVVNSDCGDGDFHDEYQGNEYDRQVDCGTYDASDDDDDDAYNLKQRGY